MFANTTAYSGIAVNDMQKARDSTEKRLASGLPKSTDCCGFI